MVGGLKAVPSANARRRAERARNAKPCAALSRTPEVARVSSIFSSNWPASTTSPSRTRISDTTPPSSDWITCNWRDGITLPSPLVTSSTCAKQAQMINTITMPMAARTINWARWVWWRDITTSASSSKWRSWAEISALSAAVLPNIRFVSGSKNRWIRSSTASTALPALISRLWRASGPPGRPAGAGGEVEICLSSIMRPSRFGHWPVLP